MRKLVISLAVIAGISVLPVFWVLNTAQGLRWLIVIADGAAPGELVIDKVGGRAVGPIRLHGVGYRDREGNTFSATELEIDWQPLALLQKRLIINSIRLGGVATELAAGVSAEADAPRQPLTLPELRLPLTLALEDIELNDVSVHRAGAELVTIERARLSGRWDENGIKIEQLQVEERRGALALHGDLKPWDGYPVTAVIDWRFAAADYPPASGTVALSGDIARLEAAWSIRSPAAIDGTVEVMLPLETPLWRASVPVPLLLRSIDPGWPDIEVAGRVEAEGDLDAATLKLSTTRPAAADATVEFGPFNADMRWRTNRPRLAGHRGGRQGRGRGRPRRRHPQALHHPSRGSRRGGRIRPLQRRYALAGPHRYPGADRAGHRPRRLARTAAQRQRRCHGQPGGR
jgi:hypothetical protein